MKSKDDRLSKAKSIDLRNVIEINSPERSPNYTLGWCPFHEGTGEGHKTKSFLVYANHYTCLSPDCDEHGDIVNWYAYKLYGSPHVNLKNGVFHTILDSILGASINAPVVEDEPVKVVRRKHDLDSLAKSCHDVLLESPTRLAYYLSRGFTLHTIKRQMWGWDGQRYVVTVWEGIPRESELLALRFRARPGDEGHIRYSGVRDHNEKLLYNREALLYAVKHSTPIVVMYGEFDAQLSWQYRVPTVSPTNGALSFQYKWLEGFDGDVVFVPDRHEEKAAYADANRIGAKGWVVQLPNGPYKDYTELCQVEGTPMKLWRAIYHSTGIEWFRPSHMREIIHI
jgi:hypothetical protein